MSDESLTAKEFCAAEKISTRKLYEDWAEGRGPDFFYNGNRRIIPAEARAEWRRKRVDEAPGEAKDKAEAARKAKAAAQQIAAE